jgi:sugar phosphate isomerase/epimerase
MGVSPVSVDAVARFDDWARTSSDRLGLDLPAGAWLTAPRAKAYEAAGFRYVQVAMPARDVLADAAFRTTHALALGAALRLSGLRLILHAPHDLHAGTADGDAQLEGALAYAATAGSSIVVYHPRADGSSGRREAVALHALGAQAGALDVAIAVENLAPSYPGCTRLIDPPTVAKLVARVDSPNVGICLDIGHAHIAAGLAGRELVSLVEPALDRVILFHVHDNFGARLEAPRAGGIEPLRLDLHLAPGAGSVPWPALSPMLASHPAPLGLEINPGRRPAPATLAVVMGELLRAGSPAPRQFSGA